MKHIIIYTGMFIYFICGMPSYLQSMENTATVNIQRHEHLQTRKKHLLQDIKLDKQSVNHHKDGRKNAKKTYVYWKSRNPKDSLEDYITILDQRVTNAENILKNRQIDLDKVLTELNTMNKMFKEEEQEEEMNYSK